ncbi:11298_t:CDS:2, partial [Funneliformis geosporum]
AKEVIISKVVTLKKTEKKQKQESQPKRINIYKHQITEEELAILTSLVNTTPTEKQLNLALAVLLKISEH